jgi:hypothetical protein
VTSPAVRTWSAVFCLCLLIATAPTGASRDQRQSPSSRSNWPCGARIDPSYFQIAEATGGRMFLLAPWEIADSAAVIQASDRHAQTIFRLAGTINPGTHEFRVPIDSSVESVVFSISVQCLRTTEVLQPSGEPASGEGVTDFSTFVAERMVVVTRPAAGVWAVRAAGSGLAGVMVQARSTLALTDVEFAAAGSDRFSRVPAAAVENAVRIAVAGRPSRVEAAIVNAASKEIAPLPLTPGDGEGAYVGRFTPGPDAFRVLIRGTDAGGMAFQRVHAPLLTAR